MTVNLRVFEGRSAPGDYGEWVKVETDGADPVFVWGCGCCPLAVETDPPDGVEFSAVDMSDDQDEAEGSKA